MPPPERAKRVTPERMRTLFRNSQLPEHISQGILQPVVLKDSVIQNPVAKGEPPGTRSQIIRYNDESGRWVVEVHQYLRPNGSIGASGKPDPKRLRIGGTIFIVQV